MYNSYVQDRYIFKQFRIQDASLSAILDIVVNLILQESNMQNVSGNQ